MPTPNPEPVTEKTPVLLVHHMANREHNHPHGSLPAMQACFEAKALSVEIDISLLADGQFALLHGPLLEDQAQTNGTGPIGLYASSQVQAFHYIHKGQVTDVPVSLLSEAIELLQRYPYPVELQLDLKPDVYSSEGILARLVSDLQPVKPRVRVTSPSDWALRRLHTLDPDLALGFDPLLYMEPDFGQEREPGLPPFRQGAYGYFDDHPLASRRWGPASEYLLARAEALLAQSPPGLIWYIHAGLLHKAFEDGFDWIAYLHVRGCKVDAWTLDAHRPDRVDLARRLAARGVDQITTNTAPALAKALGVEVRY